MLYFICNACTLLSVQRARPKSYMHIHMYVCIYLILLQVTKCVAGLAVYHDGQLSGAAPLHVFGDAMSVQEDQVEAALVPTVATLYLLTNSICRLIDGCNQSLWRMMTQKY